MKLGLRLLGVLLILGSIPCYWRFRAEMDAVKRAVVDRERAAMSSRTHEEHRLASAREVKHRAGARDWSLGGLGAAVVGVGFVGYSLLGRKRGHAPATGATV